MENKMLTKSKDKLEKVDNFTKYVMAIAAGRGDIDKALKWAKNNDFEEVEKALTVSAESGTGHFLVPDEWASEIIEYLRPQVTVRRLGAQTIPLIGGTMHIPAMVGGGEAHYVGESEDIPTTKPTFDEKTLVAKKLAALTVISNDLLRKASYNVLNIVRNDLINAIAAREEYAFLYDNPEATNPSNPNLIKGLKTLANVLPSKGDVNADIAQAELALKNAHIRFVRPGIIMSPRTENFLKYYYDEMTGTYPFMQEMRNGTIFGYPYAVSFDIPTNLPVGSSEQNGTELFFVDFNEVIIGDSDEMYIDVSTEAAYKVDATNVVSAFQKDQTLIRVITENDMILRYNAAAVVISPLNWDIPTNGQ